MTNLGFRVEGCWALGFRDEGFGYTVLRPWTGDLLTPLYRTEL